ncbi:MAG: type II methionyl aminopeptidase [Thermoprotei archaeon]|nr:MAG: type II methionyl aminopeptidase [Thermoprotei archaeon]
MIDYYLRAGKIVHQVLRLALDIVEPGEEISSICRRLEDEIFKANARPAFPINISIDQVAAHDTARINDTRIVPEKGIIKVDVGAHVEGYIADAAISIPLSNTRIERELIEASANALREAIRIFSSNVRLADIGFAIERAIRSRGFNPIVNLSGHLINRYRLHAGKSVPNIGNIHMREVVKVGEVYAIEPFTTNGIGEVVAGDYTTIFRLIGVRRIKRDRVLNELTRIIWKNYDSLPFAERWLYTITNDPLISERIRSLERHRIVMGYPILVERSGGVVAQFEDTIIVLEDRVVNLTKSIELLGEVL